MRSARICLKLARTAFYWRYGRLKAEAWSAISRGAERQRSSSCFVTAVHLRNAIRAVTGGVDGSRHCG